MHLRKLILALATQHGDKKEQTKKTLNLISAITSFITFTFGSSTKTKYKSSYSD
jgi:hypothetical protein